MRISNFIFIFIAFTFHGSILADDNCKNSKIQNYAVLERQDSLVLFEPEEVEKEWKKIPYESLSLETSGCFGTCPVYKVTFHKGGVAEYSGVSNTDKVGKHTGKIGLYEYSLLVSLIERACVLDLDNKYEANWTDDETVTLKVQSGQKTNKVISDYGRQAPPEFQALVALIEKTTKNIKWSKE